MSKRLDRSKHAACGMPVVLAHPAAGMVGWVSRLDIPFIAGGIANPPFATP